MVVVEILFWVSAVLIFHAMIGYPLSLYVLNKLIKKKTFLVDLDYRPTVSVIVPAHNEEAVIGDKLSNLTSLNYPKEKMEIIIASDSSNDKTNEIVQEFIRQNQQDKVKLYIVEKRQGKTNALNEAVRVTTGEILVFSDANAMLDRDAVVNLVSYFTEEDIIYVCGRLVYINSLEFASSAAEGRYWKLDLFMRQVESNIKTITAGNGAIYAIRKSEYVFFPPINSHDGSMPSHAALNHKRALYSPRALAYEKAGASSQDEFKRKVRMFRGGIKSLFSNLRKYNVFKYGWYSYFYFGHRACRRALFLLHIICLAANLLLISEGVFYLVAAVGQGLFYMLALGHLVFGFKNRIFYYPYYYSMTLAAQLVGTYNQITGKSKPFWEKAESTR